MIDRLYWDFFLHARIWKNPVTFFVYGATIIGLDKFRFKINKESYIGLFPMCQLECGIDPIQFVLLQ
jgi:hypothetical protein